jgi:HTH-type transcriptional regulator, sugar sensing transcriptional regulator
MDDLLLKLEKLGLSSYEAKAFIALMRKHPANGYEVSKLAKIPPSRVYETLKRLKNKGVIITDDQVEPVQYYPIPYEKLIHMLRQDYISTIEELEHELQQLQPLPNIDLTWNLLGYETMITKMAELISNCTEVLMLSLWPQEFALIRGEILRAEQRGVKVIAGVFGDCGYESPYFINLTKCGETSHKRLETRFTTIIADSKEVIISEMNGIHDTVGIWTETPTVVLLAKEYIKHDIWGNILIKTVGDDQFKRLCSDNSLLSFLINNK